MTGTLHHIGAGQNRRWLYTGVIAFVTTGTTVELDIPDNIKTIEAFSLSPVGATALANGQISIDEVTAVDGDGKIVMPVVAASVTITRIAGTDSGLKVSFAIWGK